MAPMVAKPKHTERIIRKLNINCVLTLELIARTRQIWNGSVTFRSGGNISARHGLCQEVQFVTVNTGSLFLAVLEKKDAVGCKLLVEKGADLDVLVSKTHACLAGELGVSHKPSRGGRNQLEHNFWISSAEGGLGVLTRPVPAKSF